MACVFLSLDFLWPDDSFHDSVFVDDECGAEGAEILATIHALFAPYAKLLDKRLFGVGYEVEGKVMFGDELLMRGSAVDTGRRLPTP